MRKFGQILGISFLSGLTALPIGYFAGKMGAKSVQPPAPIQVTVDPNIAKGLFDPIKATEGMAPTYERVRMQSRDIEMALNQLVKASDGKVAIEVADISGGAGASAVYRTNIPVTYKGHASHLSIHVNSCAEGKLLSRSGSQLFTWCTVDSLNQSELGVDGEESCLKAAAAQAVMHNMIDPERLVDMGLIKPEQADPSPEGHKKTSQTDALPPEVRLAAALVHGAQATRRALEDNVITQVVYGSEKEGSPVRVTRERKGNEVIHSR